MIYLLEALAAWRLAHLLVNEDGPGDIFARLRYRAGVRWSVIRGPEGVTRARVAETGLARGLLCLWCVSIWSAALLRLGRRARPVALVRDILALSAGALAWQAAVGERWQQD